jgi:transposase-like protein
MNCSCPQCNSKAFKRNGFTRHGKQNHRCLNCGRQFSLEPYSPIQEFLAEKENSENQINISNIRPIA